MTVNMGEDTEQKLEKLKKNLRSVLLSSKAGVAAQRLQAEYKGLMGSMIPFKDFGFESLDEFIMSIPDVANRRLNQDHILTYFAVADETTRHIKAMVLKQRSSKKHRLSSSTQRNTNHTPRKVQAFSYNYKKNFSPVYKKARRFHSVSDMTIKVHNNAPRVIKLHPNLSDSSISQGRTVTRYENTLPTQEIRRVEYDHNVNTVKVTKETLTQVWNNANNMPPRFSKKCEVENNQKTDTYVNPLMAIGNVNRSVKIEENSVSELGKGVKDNIKKLLNVNPGGIHATKVPDVYKEIFKEDLPKQAMAAVFNGQLSDILTVNVFKNADGTKHVILPKRDSVEMHKSKYLSPPMRATQKANVPCHSQLNPGEKYRVFIVSVENCDEVYVQLKSENVNFVAMSKVFKQTLQSKNAPSLQSASVGDHVLTSDGYRAVIKSISEDECEVQKLDVGQVCSISRHRLFQLSLPAANYPQFSIRCSMHRPADTGAVWSPESCQKFKDKYQDECLIMKVVEVSSVQSMKVSTVTKHSVFFYYNGFNINSRLIHDENESVMSMQISCCDPFSHQPKETAILPDEEYCELFVFNASSTTEVEVCIIESGYSDMLVELESEMLKYYAGPNGNMDLPCPPPLNCIYAVLSEDACVRGKLISIDGNQGNIYLVDNGELETVDLQDLRPLVEEFCKFPMQVITVCLAGLEHSAFFTNPEVLQKLSEVACYHPCVCRIVSRKQPDSKTSNVVELIDTSGDSDVNINQLCASLLMDDFYFPPLPEIGCTAPVDITHTEKDLIYAQFDGKGLQKLNRTLDELQAMLKNQRTPLAKLPSNLYTGKLCLATVSKKLYRVRVEEISEKKVRGVSVFLIDIGKTVKVNRGSLMKLECETLFSIPPQAVYCQLSEAFGKTGSFGSEGEFLYTGLDEVKDLHSQTVLMRINEVSSNEEPHLVSLWIESDNKVKTCIVSNLEIQKRTLADPSEQLQSSFSSSHASSVNSSSSFSDTPDAKNASNLAAPFEISFNKNLNKIVDVHGNNSYDKVIKEILTHVKSQNLTDVNDNHLDIQKIICNSLSNFPESLIAVEVEDALSPKSIQLIPIQNIPLRKAFEASLTKFYNQTSGMASRNVNLQEGGTYALWYSKGNNSYSWYRVMVQSKINNLISVYFVDYGHCDVIEGEDPFCCLHPHFEKVPPLSLTVCLAGIAPLEAEWPLDICKRLQSLLSGQRFYAHILKKHMDSVLHNRTVFHACLCDTSKDVDIWLEEILVEKWRCAKYVA